MYLALYRKWRPRRFSDVYGQDAITAILRREVEKDAVSHAYLFAGLRGTGKTTCAKILAKAVNCRSPQGGEPCGECENCVAADRGGLLDIVEIDAASNNGVDNIRSVIEEVAYLPSQGKKRVYIIDEVHMLSGGAFNALLKTLEEPPEHVIFILCTTETHKIPATILSRCQKFDFGRIDSSAIISRLEYVSEKENITLSKDAAALIARLSEGAMRDALSLLELCAGHSSNIDYETACELLGVPDRERLHEMAEHISAQNVKACLELTDEMLITEKPSSICTELIGFFRDLSVCAVCDSPDALINELPDEIRRCKETSKLFTRSKLLYCVSVFEKCLALLPQPNVNAKNALDMTMIRLCNIEKTMDVEALFARVEALEKGRLTAPAESAEKIPAKPVQDTQKAPVKPEKPEEPKAFVSSESKPVQTGASAFGEWSEFVDAVAKQDRVAKSFLINGRGFVNGDTLQIVFDDAMSVSVLTKPTKLAILEDAAKDTLGRPVRVELAVKKKSTSGAGLLD